MHATCAVDKGGTVEVKTPIIIVTLYICHALCRSVFMPRLTGTTPLPVARYYPLPKYIHDISITYIIKNIVRGGDFSCAGGMIKPGMY